jgi:hypothetical protein
MAAPAATARLAPVTGSKPLLEGQGTKITFSLHPDLAIWETTHTPPGVDAGDAIDARNAHCATWAPQLPPALRKMGDVSGTCQYDPGVLPNIVSMTGVNQTITTTFRDGSTWAYFGWLKSFVPNETQSGQQPTAAYTIVPSNFDPVGYIEAGPTVVSVAGT